MFRTITSRLALWYAALFAVVSITVFSLAYLMLKSNLNQRMAGELLNEAKEFEGIYRSQGIEGLRAGFEREAESEGGKRVFFRLFSARMEELAASDLSAWKGLGPPPAALTSLPRDNYKFETISIPGRVHGVRSIFNKSHDGAIIQIGYTLEDDDDLIAHYRMIFGAAIAVMLICGSAVGWFTARRAMRGVERVAHTAARIGKGEFARRVPLGNEGEEINNLAMAFNNMLERIQALVTEMKEVTHGIAHDMRSPITRIRGIAETTLTGVQSIAAYREMAGMIVDECDRLAVMINTMLEIAEAEAGVAAFSKCPVDMGAVVENAHELFRPVAEDKGIQFLVDSPAEPVVTLGDVSRLQRAIANIVDNAVKYTASGGTIVLSTNVNHSNLFISVIDSGEGISGRDLPHIFERFYRGDRSRSTPGNGLGLSLAMAIVRAHSGEITVKSTPGKGSSFTVLLPRAPQPCITKR